MSTSTRLPAPPEIEYPDSDGEPMSDNTLQFEWIVTLKGGLDAAFRRDSNVFVAGDLLWYPVEGDNRTRAAPDTMVVIGRPKGYRGSYKQWLEEGIAPQVVFEVLSPGNRPGELDRKFKFYERFGVEEYYQYDPDRNILRGWLRRGERLEPISNIQGWISPRLRIRFEPADPQLEIYGPDGVRLSTYVELAEQRDEGRRTTELERQARQAAQRERSEALAEREQAQRERLEALAKEQETRRRAERLAAQLRALGIEPEE